MIPQPVRINTLIDASFRPPERPKEKEKEKKKKTKTPSSSSPKTADIGNPLVAPAPALSLMGDIATALPSRSRSSRTTLSAHSTSSHSPSARDLPPDLLNSNRYDPRAERSRVPSLPSLPANSLSGGVSASAAVAAVNSAAASRGARPSVASSNSSVRSLPASRKSSHHDEEEEDDDDDDEDEDEDDDDGEYEGRHYHHDQQYQPQHRPQLGDDPAQQRAAYRPRDSVASIKDDPFFRHYQTPQSVSLNREMMTATYERDEDDDAELVSPLSPRPRSAKKPSVDEGVNIPPQSRSGLADINIAVIGSAGVGKSTLIQRALGLRTPPTAIASSQRMSVDNVLYTVSLIEIELESFDINPERRIQWPKQINGHIVPRMDGALLLYDVMNRESIQEMPQVLSGLAKSLLPSILVSCKCDNPENTRQINVDSMEAACTTCVEAVKTAANVPETARLALSSMLRAIMSHRAANSAELSGPRRRATSSTDLEKLSETSISDHVRHSRASSDISLLQGFAPPAAANARGPQPPRGGRGSHHIALPDPQDAPPISSHPAFRTEDFDEADPPLELASGSLGRPHPPSKGADNSFLDMEESDAESIYRYSDVTPILQRNDDTFFDKPAKVAGISFDELVDRLLSQPMSRADNNFADIFLCLYRKFAAPNQLFSAILRRLEGVTNDGNMNYLTRTEIQLRIITVVAKWVKTYPGDFAGQTSHRNLENFVAQLQGEPIFAAAAQEMRIQLQNRVVEDDDTGWARSDDNVDQASISPLSGPPSPVRQRNPREYDESNVTPGAGEERERKESVGESGSARASSPAASLSPSFHTVEDYEKEATAMVPRGTLPLTKFRYDIFMDTPDDDFADEITRIDWVMFSSIRVRDFVRHVSLPLDQKEKCKSLANVNRMISHFNHIARWVANMIVMRDKAKHRARMLEKFMNVALKLRQLNNYNGLAAVLAGINSSAVHRLAQTRALVPAETQKRFARLVLLMGTQKSHFAYRLAWENSSLPRVPFIPLHRRDLVSAEEGSRTFVGANGDRINWKKFEVLAEVLLPIMKSQVVPYPNLAKREPANELILDCRMYADDEDIYQRSVSLEGSSGGALDFGKKKLQWFQKEK